MLAHQKIRIVVVLAIAIWIPANFVARSQAQTIAYNDERTVDDRNLPTGQSIAPAGEILTFPGRPNDLVLGTHDRRLFVKNHKQLLVVALEPWRVVQTLACPGGASLTGIAVSRDGQVFVSNATRLVHVYAPDADDRNRLKLERSIEFPPDSYPCGLQLSPDEDRLFVCLSKANSVAIVDLRGSDEGNEDQIASMIDVGIAPYDLQFVAGETNRLLVSNLGGRRATDTDLTAPSAGTETPVDKRGIANTSLVSVIDLDEMRVVGGVETGLHPTSLTLLLKSTQNESQSQNNETNLSILVTNSNADSASLLRLAPGESTPNVITEVIKPLRDLPFGSMPNSACLSEDGELLFVGLAGNNAIAVLDASLLRTDASRGLREPIGFIPTAWYPAALTCSQEHLFVANLKGTGSRAEVRDAAKGRNSHDHEGVLQKISLDEIRDQHKLAAWTKQVAEASKTLPIERLGQTLASDVAPKPIPTKLGDPSVFQHVIYVIKENRTYDQVFGDIPEGRGEPALCIFPEKNTPNHHALARRFGLLDNYYCNGVLSADGHSWATEANVTPYLERAFGGFSRSYTFGDDPLTYSSSGFLWDRFLDAGLSFRNYGEMNYSKPPEGMDYQSIWKAYTDGEALEFSREIGIERLRRYSCPDYPGWNMTIPDVLRMDRFLAEFETFKQNGTLPNLCIVYLPQDHLGGGVTSAAHMADNDLALGRLVAAVSGSDYWKDTLIIANEDDPQNGYDHIDGHRSLCLVVSAYSRPGVQHDFYNQTSVIRSILHIFGLPPLNQQDARSPLMTDCFQPAADLSPFTALPANFALNQSPKDVPKQTATERHWRSLLATVPIERTGMKSEADEDNLNRFVWHEMRGWATPYPAEWSGPHQRGLAELNLIVSPEEDED